ncbi:MAG: hypothetical protein CMP36_02295 [Rickettsiales bacterium]|nr:hypothetical protein [Rickettsiales bacterium]OUV80909.1 MAG: hypothetical protein CBC91_02825 [Rickettsiales bacterium TMED131]|tara:strand:- start:1228 stop:1782 length:555 start_codon:yes stop_codon:yes gene_type:complete
MSSESNKLLCAILSAFLVYLLASFLSELLYHEDNKKGLKVSYYIDHTSEKNIDVIEKGKNIASKKVSETEIINLLKTADILKGESFVKKNCSSCHDLNLPIKNKIGPSLATVFNREIGSIKDYKYSKALIGLNKNWNLLNLYNFLEKPKEWADGTKMSYRGITDTTKLINTIKYLKDNSINNEN